ncbi:hypothetical protein [Kitasatospora sp. NPDC057198]|uniref:hypothetical protein n=1 Tax=Kitasatospora sp. NPDC057198 TaxID=3346046 RepID=UPI00362E7DCD
MSGRGGVSRGCAAVVWVVLAGVVGAAAWVYLSLRPEPQPDVAKAARSAAARAADQEVTAESDRGLDRLRAALPWATYLGTTVADVCGTEPVNHGFALTRRTWTEVACSRTTTVYEAFDGDFQQRLGQLDAALAAAGWRPSDPPYYLGEQGGLVGALAYAHNPGDGAGPSEAAAAAARPNVALVRYTVPVGSGSVTPAGSGTAVLPGGAVQVAQAPYLPTLDDGTAAHDRVLKSPSSTTSYYVDWQQYDRARLSAAYPAHAAVLALSLRVGYRTGPARP